MKGKLVKIYGVRDPALESRRMEIIRALPPDGAFPDSFPMDEIYECVLVPPKPKRLRSVKFSWIRNFSGPVDS